MMTNKFIRSTFFALRIFYQSTIFQAKGLPEYRTIHFDYILHANQLRQYRWVRLRPSPDLLPQSCSSENSQYIQYSFVF